MKRINPPLLGHERWLRVAIIFGLFLYVGAYLSFRSQASNPLFSKARCGFLAVTGLPCPLCGSTRAVCAVLNGNWQRALYYNAMALPVLLVISALLVLLLVEAITGRRFIDWNSLEHKMKRFIPWFTLLVIAWWISHIALSLQRPKREIVDLKNPIAATLRSLLD